MKATEMTMTEVLEKETHLVGEVREIGNPLEEALEKGSPEEDQEGESIMEEVLLVIVTQEKERMLVDSRLEMMEGLKCWKLRCQGIGCQ